MSFIKSCLFKERKSRAEWSSCKILSSPLCPLLHKTSSMLVIFLFHHLHSKFFLPSRLRRETRPEVSGNKSWNEEEFVPETCRDNPFTHSTPRVLVLLQLSALWLMILWSSLLQNAWNFMNGDVFTFPNHDYVYETVVLKFNPSLSETWSPSWWVSKNLTKNYGVHE